jgi:hypothetical protein
MTDAIPGIIAATRWEIERGEFIGVDNRSKMQ